MSWQGVPHSPYDGGMTGVNVEPPVECLAVVGLVIGGSSEYL